MKVLLLSRYDRNGASSRVRSYQYLSWLESEGFQITVCPLWGEDYVERLYESRSRGISTALKAYSGRLSAVLKAGRYDLIWIEKELFPWLPLLFERILLLTRTPYVVDYDDAVFHRYDSHRSGVIRVLFGRKIDGVMKKSRIVIAGNAYLADRARHAGAKNVEILPSVVDTSRYQPHLPQNDVFTVGWIGTPVTASYLKRLQSTLERFCSESPAKVTLIGSGQIDLGTTPVEVKDWSEESEVEEIAGLSVGIMPLEDTPWDRGKCGYKLIQYMAAGVPVIASAVGANRDIVSDGEDGFLVLDDNSWLDRLETLRNDRELCRKMGEAARRKVEQNYSLQVCAPRLAAMLKDAVSG